MTLPTPIRTYFACEPPQDSAAFAAAFSEGAIVQDEGAVHSGPVEIVAWWRVAKAKYRHRAEPLDMTEVAGKHLVRARVTGDFPGSPAVLTFTFGLSEDQIHELRIG